MITKETTTSFSVILSPFEMWFLLKLSSSGVVVGISEPYAQFTEEERLKIEAETKEKLENDKVIKLKGAGQYLVDELISAMLYSAINWSHLMTIKDMGKKKERYFYFLPEWQLEQFYDGENYILTLLKDREEIWSYLVNKMNIQPAQYKEFPTFDITEKNFELALFLYGSGKKEQAIKLFTEENTEVPINWDLFLSNYSNPINFLSIETINRSDETKNPVQRIRHFFQLDHAMFWVTRARSSEDDPFRLYFRPIDISEAETAFLNLLPNF